MKLIPLTQGKFAQVDDDDFAFLTQWKWFAHFDGNNFYAGRQENQKELKMHRVIMNCNDGELVDHIDINGLNNQKLNLRKCTFAENLRNKKKYKNNQSNFKGVKTIRKKKKHEVRVFYIARITIDRNCIYLGSFNDEVEAAKAYDTAAIEHHGKFASLNFKQ